MQSISPDREKEQAPLVGTVMISCYAAVAGVYFAALALPELFQPASRLFILSIIFFSLLGAFYRISTWNLRLPMLWHGFIIITVLGLGWCGWVSVRSGSIAITLSRPLTMLGKEWKWLLVVAVCLGLTWWFGDLLRCLATVPRKPTVPKISERIWEDVTNRISLGPWETAWKSWRGSLCIIITVEALGFAVTKGIGAGTISASAGWLLLLEAGIGLSLWSLGCFYYQRAFWYSAELTPGPGLSCNWLRACAGLITIFISLALLMPAAFPTPNWDYLGRLLAKLELSGGETVPESIWSGNRQQAAETPPPVNREFSIISLLMGLLYQVFLPLLSLLFGLGVIGYLCYRLCAGEFEKVKGLRGALIKFYLFWRNLFHYCLSSVTEYLGMKPLSQDSIFDPGRSRESRPRFQWGRGPQAIIRRGYYRLIQLARRSGLSWRRTRTPEELAADLARILPQDEEVIVTLTEDYQMARYGPEPPAASRAGRFERLRRVVLNHLKGKGRSNDSED